MLVLMHIIRHWLAMNEDLRNLFFDNIDAVKNCVKGLREAGFIQTIPFPYGKLVYHILTKDAAKHFGVSKAYAKFQGTSRLRRNIPVLEYCAHGSAHRQLLMPNELATFDDRLAGIELSTPFYVHEDEDEDGEARRRLAAIFVDYGARPKKPLGRVLSRVEGDWVKAHAAFDALIREEKFVAIVVSPSETRMRLMKRAYFGKKPAPRFPFLFGVSELLQHLI